MKLSRVCSWICTSPRCLRWELTFHNPLGCVAVDRCFYFIIILRVSSNMKPPCVFLQCVQWVDDAKLNQLRREGIRYVRVQLCHNDIYFIPRNVIHQFKTVSAVCSLAWHIRLKQYHPEEKDKEEEQRPNDLSPTSGRVSFLSPARPDTTVTPCARPQGDNAQGGVAKTEEPEFQRPATPPKERQPAPPQPTKSAHLPQKYQSPHHSLEQIHSGCTPPKAHNLPKGLSQTSQFPKWLFSLSAHRGRRVCEGFVSLSIRKSKLNYSSHFWLKCSSMVFFQPKYKV